MGFERVLAVLEGQYSVYGTTLFRPIVERIAEVSGRAYPFPVSDHRLVWVDVRLYAAKRRGEE